MCTGHIMDVIISNLLLHREMIVIATAIILIVLFYIIFKMLSSLAKTYSIYYSLNNYKEEISSGIEEFEKLLSNESPYMNHYAVIRWGKKYNQIIVMIKQTKEIIDKREDDIKHITTKLMYYIDNSEELRMRRNKEFIPIELKSYSSIFEDVDGNSLDIQQRKAVITNEDNNLVIAGAGSGKTSSIIGKVNYILNRYEIIPEKILVVSFTNKSAAELKQRIGIEGVRVSTFHKLGKDIIYKTKNVRQRVYESDNLYYDLKSFLNVVVADENYKIGFMRFLILYMRHFGDEVYTNERQAKISTQRKLGNGFFGDKISLTGKKLKSMEEVIISDFLSLNQVNFRYEEPYEINTAGYQYAQYEPDFTIYQRGKKYYLEHFGIDINGNPPTWFDDPEKYRQGIKWKRSLHRKHGTTLIETYSYEARKGKFEEILREKLTQAGIELKPIAFKVFKEELKKNQKYLSDFIKLVSGFLNLLKANNYDIDIVQDSIHKNIEERNIRRTLLFMELFKPIYNLYEDNLVHRNEIDFSDMIRTATEFVEKNEYKEQYDFIIIDEFQDMSKGRYELLRAIRKSNPHSILYAVGDDWQSIFRFTGSDIGLLKNFERYFGITELSKIETTYRFANPLIEKSSEFIMKNELQIRKELKSNSQGRRTNLVMHFYDQNSILNLSNSTEDYYEIYDNVNDFYNIQNTMIKILDDLNQKIGENISAKKFLMLGRYNHDINKLVSLEKGFSIINKEGEIFLQVRKYPSIEIKFLTVHKAKGLQADFVFLINCEDGIYGFPSLIDDDPILNLLLSDIDKYSNAEERRLFYVALTRAKEQMHLLVNCQNPSPFIEEFIIEDNIIDNRCPLCGIGFKIKRSSRKNGNEFWGCSNYKYGCDWTARI